MLVSSQESGPRAAFNEHLNAVSRCFNHGLRGGA
jgi:hypothetical protein